MRPSYGISMELAILLLASSFSYSVPFGFAHDLYVLFVQAFGTYLIHCPAHYFVGRAVGIRFTSIRLGKTTLARVLPGRFKRFAKLIPILTLSTDRASLEAVSVSSVRAMYASGTIASTGSAVFVALKVAATGSQVAILLTSVFAIFYLLFDIVFSPKGGDLMRARTYNRV